MAFMMGMYEVDKSGETERMRMRGSVRSEVGVGDWPLREGCAAVVVADVETLLTSSMGAC